MTDTRLHRLFNRARMDDREMNELLGLASGIVADGTTNKKEADFLYKWLIAHNDVSDNPVIATLMDRISEMLKDGQLDGDEAAELHQTLINFSGGDFEIGESLKSTSLPFDRPQPLVEFPGKRFCFTGTFGFGSRTLCESVVENLGGMAVPMGQKVNYLVVGVYASEDWAHSSFGRKIEKAVEFRNKGLPLAIIGEQHWRDHFTVE